MSNRSLLTAAILSLSFALGACCGGGKEPDKWADAGAKAVEDQKKKEDPKPGDPKPAEVKVTKSGSFNKFFPKDGTDGLKLTPAADKDGYSEYKAEKDGKEVGRLSIDDADASEKGKYTGAKDKVGSYPMFELGKNKSSILVADKYQVSITSPTMDSAARKALFDKFDLAGLAKL